MIMLATSGMGFYYNPDLSLLSVLVPVVPPGGNEDKSTTAAQTEIQIFFNIE